MIISSFFWTTFILSDYPSFKKQKKIKNKTKKKKKTTKKKKKKKKKTTTKKQLGSTSRIEAYLDLLLYFALFEHKAAISAP